MPTLSLNDLSCKICFLSPSNKSDGVQTADLFLQSARALVSQLPFKWYIFMFLVVFCSIKVEILDFSEIELVCDQGTNGKTDGHTRVEMRECIFKKSGKYWGLRRNGWAGAVSGGQGQYRLFHYPSQIFSISKKFLRCFFGWLGPKN